MALKSINPATGKELANFDSLTDEQLKLKLDKAQKAFESWKNLSFPERAVFMKRAADLLRNKAQEYAEVMTMEMGKPISQAVAESEKCAWVCDFYADKAEGFLAPEFVDTDASRSYVQYDPMGIVLAVMPWNYPFWQVFRAAAPILMAGNSFVLKHASNVPQCGMKIEEIFREAGFPDGVMQYVAIGASKVESIIVDDRVKAVTLTGSEYAGSKVAEACGREIKKTLLELGGSGPFIVLEDADIDKAAETAVMARFQNCGQSCIASKRFIVVESVYEEFVEKFRENLSKWKFGNPYDPEVNIGPLYAGSGFDEIKAQVEDSVADGARVVAGAGEADFEGLEVQGTFYQPTILADVTEDMKVFKEETFGPVAAVVRVSDVDEAVRVANNTRFGLSSSVWTQDLNLAAKISTHLNFGAVFVNGMVKSDPRMPFGGMNKSGYGRELAVNGIREFVEVKSVWMA